MSSNDQDVVVPGQRLGAAGEYRAGTGTYARSGHIYASLVGVRRVTKGPDNDVPSLEVEFASNASVKAPEVGDIVIGRITKITTRQAMMEVLCLQDKALKEAYSGVIRKEDVRATDIDNVEIVKSFVPGDIVRAKIISLGDARSYYLSTAANDLGVVVARGESGNVMVPISWREMQCPETKKIEFRKVAKIE